MGKYLLDPIHPKTPLKTVPDQHFGWIGSNGGKTVPGTVLEAKSNLHFTKLKEMRLECWPSAQSIQTFEAPFCLVWGSRLEDTFLRLIVSVVKLASHFCRSCLELTSGDSAGGKTSFMPRL